MQLHVVTLLDCNRQLYFVTQDLCVVLPDRLCVITLVCATFIYTLFLLCEFLPICMLLLKPMWF